MSGRQDGQQYRLYCGAEWLQRFTVDELRDKYRIDKDPSDYPLGVWVEDLGIPEIYKATSKADQCSTDAIAFTLLHRSITICTSAFQDRGEIHYTVNSPALDATNEGDFIDDIQSLADTILHETLHLLKREGMCSG